jgi:hypothetical protein
VVPWQKLGHIDDYFTTQKIKKLLQNRRSFLVRRAGIGFGSRVVVTPLGLATASRFRLVPEHRCGVRSPTQAKLLAYSRLKTKDR